MGLFANRKPPPSVSPASASASGFDQLLDQRQRLDAEIRERQGNELETLKRRITALAAVLGMTVAQLLGLAAPAAKKDTTSRLAKPKYRHPTEPLTWSGRGKPPQWMQAFLDAGADKADFRIDKS